MWQSRSHSSISDARVSEKIFEAITFLRWRLRTDTFPKQFDKIFAELDDYRSIYEKLSGQPFAKVRALEIGFGARPLRLIAAMSMGIDVQGIDLDTPMLDFRPGRIIRILRANGPERALKTTVRNLLFDRKEREALRNALEQRGFKLQIESSRLLVGDAATYDYGAEKFDFVYSEDVFEHIPVADLEKLAAKLSLVMSAKGVALIRPNIFTGITGGHLLEWYPSQTGKRTQRRSEPWEHLRKARQVPNTYLNRLPRSQYRALFAKYFDIVEENVDDPNLGREWLTPEVREDLSGWGDEELFSNRVQFVLRTKTGSI